MKKQPKIEKDFLSMIFFALGHEAHFFSIIALAIFASLRELEFLCLN